MTDTEITERAAFLKLLNEVAHIEGVCKGCGGMGSDPGTNFKCPTCDGTSKVFVLGEMVRVKCRWRYPGVGVSEKHPNKCKCSGRGTVGSEKMEDWVEAAKESWCVIFSEVANKTWCQLENYITGHAVGKAFDPDPFTALVMAMKAVKQ